MGPHSLGFAPALQAGFSEMLSPGGMMGIFFFIVFLYVAVYGPRVFWPSVFGFIIGNGGGRLLWVMGFFDWFLEKPVAMTVIGSYYLLFALMCIGVGIWLVYEWYITVFAVEGRGGRIRRKLDVFESVKKGKRWQGFLFWMQGFLAGVVLVVFQTVWGNDNRLAVVFMQLFSPGQEPAGYLLFPAYTIVMQIPFLAFALFAWIYLGKENGRARLRRVLTKVQVIFAAVFLGFGMSFLWVYTRQLIAIYRF